MGKTIAQDLMDKGRKEGETRSRQHTLLRQLGKRFGELPAATVTAVESTRSIRQLDTWLDRVLTAATIKDVGIG